jgi:hypothetical protein
MSFVGSHGRKICRGNKITTGLIRGVVDTTHHAEKVRATYSKVNSKRSYEYHPEMRSNVDRDNLRDAYEGQVRSEYPCTTCGEVSFDDDEILQLW